VQSTLDKVRALSKALHSVVLDDAGLEHAAHRLPLVDVVEDIDRAAEALASRVPTALHPLARAAYNLRWSWDPATRALFQALAPEPWGRTHNPIAVLKSAANDPDRLAELLAAVGR